MLNTKYDLELEITMSQPHPQKLESLVDFSLSNTVLKLEEIRGASFSLKTRLLEVGLTKGTLLKVQRNGGYFLIQLRGDTLLLRAHEAQYLMVSSS